LFDLVVSDSVADPDQHDFGKPDPNQSKKPDPDPHQSSTS
jgi:hypothetical protein